MAQVIVTIDGRSYRMACDDGQEAYIQELSSNLDDQVSALRQQFGAIGDMRLLLMAALIISDDLKVLNERIASLEVENQQLKTTRTSLLDQSQSDQKQIADYIDNAANEINRFTDSISNADHLSNEIENKAQN